MQSLCSRPETEELVELILSKTDQLISDGQSKILEMCCGSGAISLSLLQSCPDLDEIVAFDSTKNAVALTMENAILNGLDERILLKHARLESDGSVLGQGLDGLVNGPDVRFDVIVSNPPYVLRKDLMDLEPEIRL